MNIQTTKKFDKSFAKLPEEAQEVTLKQLKLLLSNPQHPSLHTKIVKGTKDIWEGRVSYQYRFTYQIEGEKSIIQFNLIA